MVQKIYANLSGLGEVAKTLHEWIFALKNPQTESLTGNFPATKELIQSVYTPRISIIAVSGNESSRIKIERETASNFSQKPALYVSSNSSVKSLNGTFILLVPNNDSFCKIWLKPGAKLKVEKIDSIRFMIGEFLGKGTFKVHTPLASLTARDAEFAINLEVESTTLNVLNGEVQLVSSADDEAILNGQNVTMNKRGRIRRPKDMDKDQFEALKKDFQ